MSYVYLDDSEKIDKLYVEKREEFQHEVQRLFMFGATANANE